MKTRCCTLVINSDDNELVGILHDPEPAKNRGIVFITGGPQYRVGSHRQFVSLARMFAESGYPVLRFDYHGMGDSGGSLSDFQDCEEDLHLAISAFIRETGVSEVVLWGLCDAASAILMFAVNESNVAGLILINPWVRSDQGLARTYLRHYYMRRLVSGDFLKSLLAGQLQFRQSVRDLFRNIRTTIRPSDTLPSQSMPNPQLVDGTDFRELMLKGMSGCQAPVLIILCGEDLTANEFSDYVKSDRRWRKMLHRSFVTIRLLEGADHTFSNKLWRKTVSMWMCEWMDSW